jgi:hypothetical protein
MVPADSTTISSYEDGILVKQARRIHMVEIRPMDSNFILYRCLHGGPMNRETIGRLNETDNGDWWEEMMANKRFDVNTQFLRKVINVYGSCGILAWDDDDVVGCVRFFPQALLDMMGVESLCMQQKPPYGIHPDVLEMDFPTADEAKRKPLRVNCMMTCPPSQKEYSYRRKGVGSAMIRELISWARENKWSSVTAKAYNDLNAIYEITGQAGRMFWEKLGFSVVFQAVAEEISGDFLKLLEEQAVAAGLEKSEARTEYVMRFLIE